MFKRKKKEYFNLAFFGSISSFVGKF